MERRSINILKIRGIQIKANYSWFIILLLIAWSFTANVIPMQYPQLSILATILTGAAMTVLFFASLLLHELAHALYAQSKNLPITSITLFIFGGAAEIHEEPKKPGQEFMMAAIGPITSLLLTGFFAGLFFIGAWADFTALLAIGSILAAVNFFLALFNLLPGLPLDGGRMLRASLWKMTGNKLRATKIATTGGKLLSYVLIALGFWQILIGALLGGTWFILIGLFLNAAAKSSYQQLAIQSKLEGITAQDIMQPADIPERQQTQLRPNDPIQKAIEVMGQKNLSVIYVGEDDRPAGIITADRLRQLLTRHRINLNSR